MRHKTAVLRQLPSLDQLCFQFEELSIRVFEELFVFLAPFVSSHHLAQRQDVSALADCRLPPQRIAVGLRTRVGIDILHLRNELVAHGVCQIGIGGENRVKGCRAPLHIFIGERQRGVLVLTCWRRLEVIGPLSRHDTALEESGTVENVGRELQRCRRRGEEAYTLEVVEELLAEIRDVGDNHTRQLQRGVSTILITVELRRASFAVVCRLPLIIALDFQVEELTATESVAPRDAEHGARSETVIGLSGDIALEVDVVRLVKDQVHAHVECVGATGSVAWREVDVDGTEQSC